ncbi:MAG: nicotinate (nicotinamide) nucleotide adenylyltransferase [Anaerofustis stercorihominis]|nr:nicotinate (nicotinamide) nucleotide adenylyltransferase [Anaerofustis stercorihominis]
MKIGILGGSFNPPHKSHIDLCRFVKEEMNLDRIMLIPTGEHPFKGKVGVSKYDRLEMCRLAVEGIEDFGVNDIEVLKDAPSYTIETMKALKAQSDDEYYFISGSDILFELSWWKSLRELSELVTFVSVMRDGVDNEEILMEAEKLNRAFGTKIILLEEYSPMGISSTQIRKDVHGNKKFLEEEVYDYIVKHGLYREMK